MPKNPTEQPLIWSWSAMDNNDNKTMRELRDEGYAIILWTPEELGNCPTDEIEDLSIERGWSVIEHWNREVKEDE